MGNNDRRDSGLDFSTVAAVAADSGVARAAMRVAKAVERALGGSQAFQRGRQLADDFSGLDAPVRVRLAGVVLLVASLTHALLVAIVPAALAPLFPLRIAVLAAAVAVALISAAPALCAAWANKVSGRS